MRVVGCRRHRHGQQGREEENQACDCTAAGEHHTHLLSDPRQQRHRGHARRSGWPRTCPGCRFAEIRLCPINDLRIQDDSASVRKYRRPPVEVVFLSRRVADACLGKVR